MEFRVSKSIFLSFDYSFFTGQISYHPDFLYLSGREYKFSEQRYMFFFISARKMNFF
jgi:hypothetical protein